MIIVVISTQSISGSCLSQWYWIYILWKFQGWKRKIVEWIGDHMGCLKADSLLFTQIYIIYKMKNPVLSRSRFTGKWHICIKRKRKALLITSRLRVLSIWEIRTWEECCCGEAGIVGEKRLCSQADTSPLRQPAPDSSAKLGRADPFQTKACELRICEAARIEFSLW